MNKNHNPGPDSGGTVIAGIGAIRIAGDDARAFLQGQLTQDIDRLSPDQPLLTGWASAKGRLMCVANLLDWRDAVWLILPGALQLPVQRRLGMFVLRADLSIETPTVTLSMINNIIEKESSNYCFEKDNKLYFRHESGPALCLNPDETAPPAAPNTLAEWRSANIRAGLPSIWPTTTETFVPQMLNLDLLGAISFSKGCYVGQEIVARTQNLGRIKRRMYGFSATADADVQPGAKLYLGERDSGLVVDAVPGEQGTELLAVVAIEQSKENFCLDADGTKPLKTRALPYQVPVTLA